MTRQQIELGSHPSVDDEDNLTIEQLVYAFENVVSLGRTSLLIMVSDLQRME